MTRLTILLLTDKRTWKALAVVLAAVLTPFVLLVIVICSMLHGAASHNNAAVELTFFGGNIPITMPADYREYITEMRSCFSSLDSAIATVERQMEDGDSLDSVRVKAVFYALYFGTDQLRLRSSAAKEFVDCFVEYEERVRIITVPDEEGNELEIEEHYVVAVPIEDLSLVYANVEAYLGRSITTDDQANITEIYLRVSYRNFDVGADMSLEGGNGTHDLIGEMTNGSEVTPTVEGFGSPISADWRSLVTSEFGYRRNPTGSGTEGHTGLDMALPVGTAVKAAKSGKVLFVRYKLTGYGYHVAIDHGGGLVTLYAHCSEILVIEGQEVSAGTVIAKSGNTGRSTGPHLHLEIIQDGVPQNPRNYLS